jgi:hypothetical protein
MEEENKKDSGETTKGKERIIVFTKDIFRDADKECLEDEINEWLHEAAPVILARQSHSAVCSSNEGDIWHMLTVIIWYVET